MNKNQQKTCQIFWVVKISTFFTDRCHMCWWKEERWITRLGMVPGWIWIFKIYSKLCWSNLLLDRPSRAPLCYMWLCQTTYWNSQIHGWWNYLLHLQRSKYGLIISDRTAKAAWLFIPMLKISTRLQGLLVYSVHKVKVDSKFL